MRSMPNCLISRWKDNFPSGNDAYSPKRFKINQEWREDNVNLGACLFSVLLVFFFFMVWLMTLALRETLHLPRSSWARLSAFYSNWNIWPHNALHCHNRTRLEAYWQKTFGTFWSFRLFLQENRSREENGVKNNLACFHAYLDLALV